MVKRAVAVFAASAVFNADTVLAWAAGVVFGVGAYGALGLPWLLAAGMALVVVLGVWRAAGALCGPWMMRWSGRIDRWGNPPAVRRAAARVEPLAALLEPVAVRPVPAPKSQSTGSRPLKSYELAGWECWRCGETAVEGTHAWEDRGPFQLLSKHAFTCPNGHRWTNSTDGG